MLCSPGPTRAALRCARRPRPRLASLTSIRRYTADTFSLKTEPPSASGSPSVPLYYVDDSAAPVSPWHDLPLHGGGGRAGAASPLFNCVCEVPRGSRAEYRLSTSVAHNPLVFARAADGTPRALALATLAHHGVLPQTYEDPAERDAATGARGDGGPLDVCEIGTLGAPTAGAIYQVRVLGALAVLDEGGRGDWKILALRADDPQAATLADIAGAPASVARLAEDIRTWFRLREVPRGGAERRLALDGAWQGREAALAIVEASHARWRALTARARSAAAAEARAIAYGEEALLARLDAGPWVSPAPGAPARHFNSTEASLAAVRMSGTLARRAAPLK